MHRVRLCTSACKDVILASPANGLFAMHFSRAHDESTRAYVDAARRRDDLARAHVDFPSAREHVTRHAVAATAGQWFQTAQRGLRDFRSENLGNPGRHNRRASFNERELAHAQFRH
jgi:hypothetical protein